MSASRAQHEEFKVAAFERKKVVRQDRIDTIGKDHLLTIGDFSYELLNISEFGIALISDLPMPDEIFEASLKVSGYEIGEFNFRKVREDNSNDNKIISAFTVIGRPINTLAIESLQEVNNVLTEHKKEIEKSKLVDKQFTLKVLEFKQWIYLLEAKVNSLEKSSFSTDRHSVDLFEDLTCQQVSRYLSDSLTPVYKDIESIIKRLEPEQIKNCYSYFRDQLGSLLYQSAYASRAFFKPKGYAGDFEMMNNVYLMEPRGDSLFAKCLQRYFVDEPAGKAVRNRSEYLQGKIVSLLKGGNKKIKVLAVASGPAMELQKILINHPELFIGAPVEFHLMDQDLDSLKYAQRKIEGIIRSSDLKSVSVYYHNLAIKNVIVEGFQDKDFDLIYSAGLFDYLSAPVAQIAATRFLSALNEDGQLIIGNFSLDNPNQFAMSMIMDWHLIYRSISELKNMFQPICHSVSIEQEDLGINLFAVLEK